MSRLEIPLCTVVPSATHFEIELLKWPAPEVEFSSEAEEAEYQEQDAQLAEQIHAVALASLSSESSEELIQTNWDWYPNKSRSLGLDAEAFSLALVEALLSLLDGKYADWRIYLNVYKSLSESDEDFGVACLSKQKVIIQKSLYERLSPSA